MDFLQLTVDDRILKNLLLPKFAYAQQATERNN